MTDLPQVFDDLVRYETRLYNVLGERLRAGHGLSTGQYEFLRLIAERDRCRVQDLAEHVALTVGATSKGVDRMVAAGLVRRRPHPSDRRSSLLELTAAGRRTLAGARSTVEAALRTWLAEPVTARQLDQLAVTLSRLRGVIQDAGAGMPTG